MAAKHTPVRRGTDALGALLHGPLLAGAVLIAVSCGQHAGSGQRSWWRRGENLRADAQAAKDAAAQAFYDLDTAQRDLQISLETIAAVDKSPPARRAAEDFREISRRIDEASNTYITAVDAHDLDKEELEAGEASRARAELTKAKDELLRVKADLDRFTENIGPLVAKAEEQLAKVAPGVERARQALRAATEALDGVRSAGLNADDLAARLAALGPELTKLNQGAAAHGVPETLRRAEQVAAQAEDIRARAAELPEKVREIDRRLVSLRTRVEALANRIPTVDPVLSELRRRFSSACWQDLQNVPAQAHGAVEQARAKLTEATRARDQQRWADAGSLLSTVRALMNTADEGITAAARRLDSLNEVSADPKKEIERTRFTVRDAQRLAMAGRSTPDPKHARPLDDAVLRMDRAVAALEGRHPDFWSFLTEMAAVRETAGRVVAAIREERAGGH